MNEVVLERRLQGAVLQVVRGDLTEETTDVIVNAANPELRHGAGVAGAIVRRGGASIQEESDAWVHEHGPVLHEAPAWTSGGSLSAKYVIHAVGPVWGEGEEDAKLKAAILGSLRVADELGVESISIPAISTGIFGFPLERAADLILSSLRDYMDADTSKMRLVRIVLIDAAASTAFVKALEAMDR